jgi:uncharacterized protein
VQRTSTEAGQARRLKKTVGLALASLGLLATAFNALAFRHSYALTHFTERGIRTRRPEALAFSEKLLVLATGAKVPRPRNRRSPRDLGLAYERHVFEGARRLPLEAWYIPRRPSRGLIVIFHGHADSKDSQLNAASRFREMGYSTFLVDFYGSGGSGGAETSIGFHEATDVANAYEYSRHLPGERAVFLYGGSMGAAAILKAAADRQFQPEGLILEMPFDNLLNTVRHRFGTMGLPSFPAAELLVFWGGWQQGFNGFRHNPVDDAGAVRCPTLLMNGDRDPWVTIEEAQAIFDRLRGPKQMKIFRGLQHQSFLNARPAEWRLSVSSFLAEYSPTVTDE